MPKTRVKSWGGPKGRLQESGGFPRNNTVCPEETQIAAIPSDCITEGNSLILLFRIVISPFRSFEGWRLALLGDRRFSPREAPPFEFIIQLSKSLASGPTWFFKTRGVGTNEPPMGGRCYGPYSTPASNSGHGCLREPSALPAGRSSLQRALRVCLISSPLSAQPVWGM